MAITQAEKYRLCLAGEFGVCSELSKLGYDVNITMGNAKAVDVVLFKNGSCVRIEVKTSRSSRFVTNFFQKYYDPSEGIHPDFWVLVHIDKDNKSHYYILSHQEMGDVQMKRNGMTAWAKVDGCDNVLLKDVKGYGEGMWDKIK